MYIAVLLFSLATSFLSTRAYTCPDNVVGDPTMPCIEVRACSDSANMASIAIDALSSGAGPGQSVATVGICYLEESLQLTYNVQNQYFFPTEDVYSDCNSAIWNEDTVEAFIAPGFDANQLKEPKCYGEFDISPYGVKWQGSIYNKNLNGTGMSSLLYDCDETASSSSIHNEDHYWTATLTIDFSLLNCPRNCPSCDTNSVETKPLPYYRVNFYRINELSSVADDNNCNLDTSACEYLAWSPNLHSPPSFHQPLYFGMLVIV